MIIIIAVDKTITKSYNFYSLQTQNRTLRCHIFHDGQLKDAELNYLKRSECTILVTLPTNCVVCEGKGKNVAQENKRISLLLAT